MTSFSGGGDLRKNLTMDVNDTKSKHEHDHLPRTACRVVWNNPLECRRVRIGLDLAVAHGADQRETRMQIETRTDLTSVSSPAKTSSEEVISQPQYF